MAFRPTFNRCTADGYAVKFPHQAMRPRRTLALAVILTLSVTSVGWAQIPNSNDFDPATRAAHNLAAPPAPGTLGGPAAAPDAAAPAGPTPEQLAEQQRQQQMADIAAKREAAKQKAAAADKERKDKATAAKAAEMKRMAAQKMDRQKAMDDRKAAREQLKVLEKEETTARKAYHDSLKSATTGDARHQAEDAFQKAEADRRKKIADLRHPHSKKSTDSTSSPASGAGSSTGLNGTTTTH